MPRKKANTKKANTKKVNPDKKFLYQLKGAEIDDDDSKKITLKFYHNLFKDGISVDELKKSFEVFIDDRGGNNPQQSKFVGENKIQLILDRAVCSGEKVKVKYEKNTDDDTQNFKIIFNDKSWNYGIHDSFEIDVKNKIKPPKYKNFCIDGDGNLVIRFTKNLKHNSEKNIFSIQYDKKNIPIKKATYRLKSVTLEGNVNFSDEKKIQVSYKKPKNLFVRIADYDGNEVPEFNSSEILDIPKDMRNGFIILLITAGFVGLNTSMILGVIFGYTYYYKWINKNLGKVSEKFSLIVKKISEFYNLCEKIADSSWNLIKKLFRISLLVAKIVLLGIIVLGIWLNSGYFKPILGNAPKQFYNFGMTFWGSWITTICISLYYSRDLQIQGIRLLKWLWFSNPTLGAGLFLVVIPALGISESRRIISISLEYLFTYMLEYPKCSCLFIWFLIIKFLGDNLRNFSEKKGIKNDYIQKKENEKKKNDDKKSDKKNVDKKSDKKGDDKKSDKKGEQIKTPHHSINSESKSSNKIRKIVSIPKYDGKRLFVKKHIFETTVNEEKDPDKISEYKKLYELRKRGTFGKGYYLKSCRDLKTVNEGP